MKRCTTVGAVADCAILYAALMALGETLTQLQDKASLAIYTALKAELSIGTNVSEGGLEGKQTVTPVLGSFAQVTGASGVTVTADDLSTRAPTGSPSISTAPTVFPSASPTW